MRFSYPIFCLADRLGDLSHAGNLRGCSVGVQASFDRESGSGGESAALGSCPSRCDDRVLWTTPVREFLRILNFVISTTVAPSLGRQVFGAAGA
jgi:hypothetical protein